MWDPFRITSPAERNCKKVGRKSNMLRQQGYLCQQPLPRERWRGPLLQEPLQSPLAAPLLEPSAMELHDPGSQSLLEHSTHHFIAHGISTTPFVLLRPSLAPSPPPLASFLISSSSFSPLSATSSRAHLTIKRHCKLLSTTPYAGQPLLPGH